MQKKNPATSVESNLRSKWDDNYWKGCEKELSKDDSRLRVYRVVLKMCILCQIDFECEYFVI